METEYKSGFLERWGIRVVEEYAKESTREDVSLQEDFFPRSKKIILWAVFAAGFTGFITTFVLTWTETFFPENPEMFSPEFNMKWTILVASLLFWTIVEFYILYKIGLYSVFRLAEVAGVFTEDSEFLVTKIPHLLSRIALEIPDPECKILGVDPMKMVNKKSLLVRTILYKAKVVLSNVLAKILLRKVLARNSFRVYVDFIAAPITGIWDGLVMYFTLQELRIRLGSRIIAYDIVQEIRNQSSSLRPEMKLLILQTIGNSVVFAQRFHPTLEYMLLSLYNEFQIKHDIHLLDEWEDMKLRIRDVSSEERRFLVKLLLMACSFDGKLSGLEKNKLPEIMGGDSVEENLNFVAELGDLIKKGDIRSAKEKCSLPKI